MSATTPIPEFNLFGETTEFPDLVHSERFSARAPFTGWHIEAHRHVQIVQIFAIHDGRVSALVDGTKIDLETGDFLFIPARSVHTFDFRPDTEGLVVSVLQSLVGTVAPQSKELSMALSFPVSGKLDPVLSDQIDLLERLCSTPAPFRAQKLVGVAHSVLAAIAEAAPHTDLNAQASAKFEALNLLIAEHLCDGWGARAYASALSISTGHLSRLCRDAVGMGATAYIAQKMNQEACRMLVFTQLPVAEVGYRLGYVDPSYFSKRFKATQGKTPSAYRAQFQT